MKWVALTLLLLTANLFGQAAQTGPSKASGVCAISHSGNNDTITISNCGIGAEQGSKIISLLKEILAKGDIASINAKLDELIKVARQPVQSQTCTDSNCFQGVNNGSVEQNQFGPPPATISYSPTSRSNREGVGPEYKGQFFSEFVIFADTSSPIPQLVITISHPDLIGVGYGLGTVCLPFEHQTRWVCVIKNASGQESVSVITSKKIDLSEVKISWTCQPPSACKAN